MTPFINVKRRRRSVGQWCLHCRTSATVTATRQLPSGLKLAVRYCPAHAAAIIDGEA